MNTFIFFSRAIVSLGEASQTKARLCGLCLKSQGQLSASSSLLGPEITLEGPHSQEVTRVIVTDLVAQERKFVANSRLKKAEKTNFS